MKRLYLVFMLLFTFNLFADDEEEKLRLAVMEFEDKSGQLSETTLANATEYIRGAFVSSNKFIVIAKERQENAMIKQMKKESYKLCNDKNCQIPLGQALSADTILRTTITSLGGTYTITSELIDLEKEATTKGAKATFDGDEKSLLSALDEIVAQIIGRKKQKAAFQQGRFGGKDDDWEIGIGEETIVKFESNPSGAVVIADGKMLCQTPCSKMLTQGNHEIEMQMENYVPKVKKGKITEGKTIKYTLEPDFAWLSVSGKYAVEVRLDGQNIGKIPIKDKVISTGNHKIEHVNNCFYTEGETFTVKRGEKKSINFKLENKESAIKVYAQDESGNDIEADVYVDDKKVGKAPGTFKVPLCSKKLLVKKGNDEYSHALSLKEKSIQEIHASINSADLLEQQLLHLKKDIKTDQRSNQKRDEAVKQLNDLIKDFPEGPRKAEIYRRLAELYWEKATADHSIEWNKKAVEVCEYIIKKYPTFQNLDEVYFYMASNLLETGQSSAALRYYTLVVEKFHNSKFASDAEKIIKILRERKSR